MLISYKLGQDSVILRVKIINSARNDNTGAINLLYTTTGLSISTIADNEAAATVYTSSAGTIEDITTLGTYVAPTSGKCRFKQIDTNNHSGIYEIQLDNSRYAVSDAKSLLITIAAVSAFDAAQSDSLIPLVRHDPYLSQPVNFDALNIDIDGYVILQPTGLDQIVEDGYDIRETIYVIAAMVAGESSGLPASPATFMSLDGANERAVIAFDGNSNRVSTIITGP